MTNKVLSYLSKLIGISSIIQLLHNIIKPKITERAGFDISLYVWKNANQNIL